MKFKIKQLVEKEVDVKYVRIVWEERYDDENIPYDFPCRNGDMVEMLIDIDTGKIIDFPDDWYGDCSTKLCDDGRYYLLNEKMEVVLKLDDGDYVPNKLISVS